MEMSGWGAGVEIVIIRLGIVDGGSWWRELIGIWISRQSLCFCLCVRLRKIFFSAAELYIHINSQYLNGFFLTSYIYK